MHRRTWANWSNNTELGAGQLVAGYMYKTLYQPPFCRRILATLPSHGLADVVERIRHREDNPYSAADELLGKI